MGPGPTWLGLASVLLPFTFAHKHDVGRDFFAGIKGRAQPTGCHLFRAVQQDEQQQQKRQRHQHHHQEHEEHQQPQRHGKDTSVPGDVGWFQRRGRRRQKLGRNRRMEASFASSQAECTPSTGSIHLPHSATSAHRPTSSPHDAIVSLRGMSDFVERKRNARRDSWTVGWGREFMKSTGLLDSLRSVSAAAVLRGGRVGSKPEIKHVQEAPGVAATPRSSAPWRNAVEGLKNGIASGLAAACVKTVLQPFDTMKTVQQFSTTRVTLLQAGRDLVARGGVRELYQGLGVTLVGSMPSVGVYFGLYQFVKKQMDSKTSVSPYVSITVSAGVGNFIASFFRVPYEVVKQRLQVGAYPSTMVALTSIYEQGGFWGFFGKGSLKTQWARDIPYAMVTLLVYETLQKSAAKRRESRGSANIGKALENMLIGAVAGGMGSLVTNPMDMIKTRMMTSPELYTGPMDAAWIAFRKEGPQAFMKGATPRLLHKIPANALFFVAYEFFRSLLGVTR